jgi:hypothetical protein
MAVSGLFFHFKKVFVFIFFKVGIDSIGELELLIMELLPFGGFSTQFDLTIMNQRK